MSVNNATTKTGFFKSIGNWFNRNGNTLGKSMQLAGSTAAGVGLIGMMFHEMNKSSSCCHHHHSIFGGGFGGCMSPWNSWNMGGCTSFGGMNMFNNMYSMTNPYLTMAGLQGASNYGFMNAMMSKQNMYTNPMNNPMYQSFYNQSYQKYYSQLSNNQTGINDPNVEVDYTAKGNEEVALTDEEMKNTDDGDKMDTAFNNKKSFKYAEKNATADEMKAGLEKYAKSYVAYVDTKEGDSDGLISEDEFVEHEATGSDIETTKKVFKQFDLNNSGNLDWQEYAAIMKTYDTDKDGTISATELKDAIKMSKDGIASAIRRENGDKDVFRNRAGNKLNELGYNKE